MRYVLLLILLAAAVPPARAAEPPPAVVHEYNAELEDIMRKLEEAVDAGVRDLIARQPDARSAGDVALIVGIFHHIGLFHGVDLPRAREFMEVALDNGVVEAGVTLGELHLGFALPEAESAERNVDKGLLYLEEAAEKDSVDALRLLGILYSDGADGVAPDADRAERYLLAAARHGDAEALRRLEPLFAEAAAWELEHPGEKAILPSSAEAATDHALREAAMRRGEELSAVALMVREESEMWAMRVIEEEEERKK